MAQLLKQPTPTPAGRFSQVLPSVKCSSCGRPVPVDELGEHICPPTPSVPTLPKPYHSPQSATALLPPRLQNLAASPRSPGPSPLRSAPAPQDFRPPQFSSSGSGNWPSPSTPTAPSAPWTAREQKQRVPSPLARSQPQQIPNSAHPFASSQERARTPSAPPHRDYRFERRDMDRHAYPQSQSSPVHSPLSGNRLPPP